MKRKRKVLNLLNQPYKNSIKDIKKLKLLCEKFLNSSLYNKEEIVNKLLKHCDDLVSSEEYLIPSDFDIANEFCKNKSGYCLDFDEFLFLGRDKFSREELLKNKSITNDITVIIKMIDEEIENNIEYEIIVNEEKDYKIFIRFYEEVNDDLNLTMSCDIFATIDFAEDEFSFCFSEFLCYGKELKEFLNFINKFEKEVKNIKDLTAKEVKEILNKLNNKELDKFYFERIY